MAYRGDLARIHDSGFGELAASAASVLARELRRRRLPSGLIVDLGCGSGILSERVAALGYHVLGIDSSPAMLRLARLRVPEGRFRRASVEDAKLPPAVAVAAVGECFNYLFDRRASKRALSSLLRRIHRALAPGGVLLFDMSAPGRGSARSHFESEEWAVLVSTEEDSRRRILTRRITTFLAEGSRYRRSEEVHRLKLAARKDVLAALRAAGFRARTLTAYGDLGLPRGLVGYLAITPSSSRISRASV